MQKVTLCKIHEAAMKPFLYQKGFCGINHAGIQIEGMW